MGVMLAGSEELSRTLESRGFQGDYIGEYYGVVKGIIGV